MRFLLLNQFYPPDVAPTGCVLHDLAKTLLDRGHEVRVIASQRAYDGGQRYARRIVLEGVEIARIAAFGFGRRSFLSKLFDYLSFFGLTAAKLINQQPRPEVVVALTTPPYLGLLGKMVAGRYHCRHAHWIMDLYPDVLVAHGMVTANRFCHHWLQNLTRSELKHAGTILALGPYMAQKVSEYANWAGMNHIPERPTPSPHKPPIPWVPLWSHPDLYPWPEDTQNPMRQARQWPQKELVLQYSGNMGLGHRFQEFFAAAQRLGRNGPRWVFSGGGKRRAEVQAFINANPEARVELHAYLPRSQLREHLSAANVHLVSLDSAWEGLIVPSKLQASFAVGRPVIFVGGAQNEIAAWIKESRGGWVVAENDLEGLLAAIREAHDPAQQRQRGQGGLAYAQRHFQLRFNATRVAQLLETPNGS